MARKTSQNEQIYRYLQENGSITPIDALNLCGCLRLASRIADLKRIMGADIPQRWRAPAQAVTHVTG